jgi:hypothetical protein
MLFRPAAPCDGSPLLSGHFAIAQDGGPDSTEITEAWLASPHADRSSGGVHSLERGWRFHGTCGKAIRPSACLTTRARDGRGRAISSRANRVGHWMRIVS